MEKRNSKGIHIFADYKGLYGDENEIGSFVFELMISSIKRTNMKIVHKKLVILNGDTPSGFTSVLLLDESHYTSHCYSDIGLLALDIFTCGNTDTTEIMNYFNQKLLEKYPMIESTYLQNHKRFNY
jgi:S-adenosylmethionine decarboxylase